MGRAERRAGPGPVTLVLPRNPPRSLNTMLRQHWAERKRQRDLWACEVTAAWLAAGRPRYRRKVRALVTCYYRTTRRRDTDNMTASVKPIIDALVRLGCLLDDHSEILELTVVGEVDKRHPRVEVVLEPVA